MKNRKEFLPVSVEKVVHFFTLIPENGSMASAKDARSTIFIFQRKKFPEVAPPIVSSRVNLIVTAIIGEHGKPVKKRTPTTHLMVKVSLLHFLHNGINNNVTLIKFSFAKE